MRANLPPAIYYRPAHPPRNRPTTKIGLGSACRYVPPSAERPEFRFANRSYNPILLELASILSSLVMGGLPVSSDSAMVPERRDR